MSTAALLLRTVTQLTVTLRAALIGVSDVLAGLIVERFLRSFGRLWYAPSGWELKFMSPQNAYGDTVEVNPEEATVAGADYSVGLDLFNGKELPVGLHNISMVFTHYGGELVQKPGTRPAVGSPAAALPTRFLWW